MDQFACQSLYDLENESDFLKSGQSENLGQFEEPFLSEEFEDLGASSWCTNEQSFDLQALLNEYNLGSTPPESKAQGGDNLLQQFGQASSPNRAFVQPETLNNPKSGPATIESEDTIYCSGEKSCEGLTDIQNHISQVKVKQEFEMPQAEGDHLQYYTLPQQHSQHAQIIYAQPQDMMVSPAESSEQDRNEHEVEVVHTTSDPSEPSRKRARPQPSKDTPEYKEKRERNNVAVRKSREKSKVRNKELQDKVSELQTENDRLNKRVELLTKELTVLRSLFTTVGKSAPHSLEKAQL